MVLFSREHDSFNWRRDVTVTTVVRKASNSYHPSLFIYQSVKSTRTFVRLPSKHLHLNALSSQSQSFNSSLLCLSYPSPLSLQLLVTLRIISLLSFVVVRRRREERGAEVMGGGKGDVE